ncbi:uncharacterized protein [Venturia canescens]|uniref:uncharacterized protein n=1 Tax=Venturia canescens TaxID=32260 RepID=UPI001C9C3030|nr:uncharacterized protein LOC122406618 [Venturia canescens]
MSDEQLSERSAEESVEELMEVDGGADEDRAAVGDNLEDPVPRAEPVRARAGRAYSPLPSSDSRSSDDDRDEEVPEFCEDLTLGVKEETKIVFWNNVEEFSVSFLKNKLYASWLNNKIKKCSRRAFSLAPKDIVVGQMCLASKKGHNKRGKIQSIDGEWVNLDIVDIGVTKKYRIQTLRQLPEDLRTYPALAFRCQSSIGEAYANANLVELIDRFTQSEKTFEIKPVERLGDHKFRVELFLSEDFETAVAEEMDREGNEEESASSENDGQSAHAEDVRNMGHLVRGHKMVEIAGFSLYRPNEYNRIRKDLHWTAGEQSELRCLNEGCNFTVSKGKKEVMRDHWMAHHRNKKYMCVYCFREEEVKNFVSTRSLVNHCKRVHVEERRD